MKPIKICFFIIICLSLICCGKDKNDKSIVEENKAESISYEEIVYFININRNTFVRNNLETIEVVGLLEEQELFYNKRLDFFIGILTEDENLKLSYYNYVKESYKLFNKNGNNYYSISRNVFDDQLLSTLENKFGNMKLPMEYMNEYYRETHFITKIDIYQ
jgi:hypothetical protein